MLSQTHPSSRPQVLRLYGNSLTLREKLNYLGGHPGFRAAPAGVLFRLLVWRWYCALGIPGSIDLPSWQVRMLLPPEWHGMSKAAFAFREQYEQELKFLSSALSSGDVFIDVGACYGIYALVAARLVGEMGRVLAFEPAAEASAVLHRNLALNGFANVLERRVALADRSGRTPLFLYADQSRNSLSRDDSAVACQSVETSTLDQELDQANLHRAEVIKIDAEGAEELILRGAKGVLGDFHPLVIFEVNPPAASRLGLRADGAWNLLRKYGYRFLGIDARGYLHIRTLPPKLGTVIAVHRHT